MDRIKKGNPTRSTLVEKIQEIADEIRLNPPEMIDQGNNETMESNENDIKIMFPPQTFTESQKLNGQEAFSVEKECLETKDKETRCVQSDSARYFSPMSLQANGDEAEIIPEQEEPGPNHAIGESVHRRANIQEVEEALRKISEDRKKLMEIPIQFERVLERSTADDLSELANY